MAGLLDYITEAAKAQYAKGAPYRNALGGLLSGDMSALQELNKPSPVMPNEALDVAMTFAPMGIVGGDITKILKSLKQQNPSTYPKIPVNKIFKNDVGNLESLDRMKADEGFLNNATTNQFVNINDIIPTQKNVTTKNIKDINNVSALPELIKVNDKYYVNDGHHRISRDILTGDDKIQAKVYEGLLSNNKTPLTEFEVKQLTAQRNAALPVAEGGLGLPASNTAMDRAKAMGFNTKVYHGTTKAPEEGIRAFDLNLAGKQTGNPNSVLGVFATPNPIEASRYTKDFGKQEYPSVYPLMIKTGKQYEMPYSEADNLAMQLFYNKENPKALALQKRNELLNEGYDSIKVKINPDEIVSMNPSNVRSVNAAFDPFRRNEADILAGVGVGVPVASGLLDIENKKVPNKEKKKTK